VKGVCNENAQSQLVFSITIHRVFTMSMETLSQPESRGAMYTSECVRSGTDECVS
jgi:hypothetical protein